MDMRDARINYLEITNHHFRRNIAWLSVLLGIALFLLVFATGFVVYKSGLFDSWTPQIAKLDTDNDTLNIVVYIENLTDTEEEEVKSIMQDVKRIYLTGQGKITFTKNIIQYQDNQSQEGVLGLNKGNKDIYVLYENKKQVKYTLCHELIHSFMLRDENAHEIVYDLERYLPCYESTPIP